MVQQDYLTARKRINYTPLEIKQLKEGVKNGVSLLELQILLSRSAHGIVKKLRMLTLTDSETWKREWFLDYRRELNDLNKGEYSKKRREYYQTHKEEHLSYKRGWRELRRENGLKVT